MIKKMREILNSEEYQLLNKNLTTSIKCKAYKMLCKYKNELQNHERFKFTSKYSKFSHIYGLPNVYKINILLISIVTSKDGRFKYIFSDGLSPPSNF